MKPEVNDNSRVDETRALLKKNAKEVKKKQKKERFQVLRMWISTFISAVFNDRGTIPPNIGDNILVTNNVYITKYSLSALIGIVELSNDTPVGFISDLVSTVKRDVPGIIIDTVIKNIPYYIDTKAPGMKSRRESWEKILSYPLATERMATRAARQIYTLTVAESGEKLYRSRIYITVRAMDGTTLNAGIDKVSQYLNTCALYRVVRNNLQDHLEYVAMSSSHSSAVMKDVGWIVTSQQTIAEMLPQSQGLNDVKGIMIGIASENNSPYYIDFMSSSAAKNLYLIAKSGAGKTFMGQTILLDAFTKNFNVCAMDIKGTELGAFTRACGGKTLQLRSTSTTYINTYKLESKDVKNGEYRIYFNKMFNATKVRLQIMAGVENDPKYETLFDKFLRALYTEYGVREDNENTWYRSEQLDPFVAFDYFKKWLSPKIQEEYGEESINIMNSLSMYMSRSGSMSHIFKDQYTYSEVINTKVLTFDFGMLEESESAMNSVVFKLKVLDMITIKTEFIASKKAKGEWTFVFDEESQYAPDYLLDEYKKDVTMGRANNQATAILGNSVKALRENPRSKAILDSINILLLGKLNVSDREYFIKEYDLASEEQRLLDDSNKDESSLYKFILINRMQAKATKATITAPVPKSVRDSMLYKVVDTIEE